MLSVSYLIPRLEQKTKYIMVKLIITILVLYFVFVLSYTINDY